MSLAFSSFDLRLLIRQIPRQVWFFLGKTLLLFLVWKGIYLLWLSPDERLDTWLIDKVAQHTVWVLNTVNGTHDYRYQIEIINADKADGIYVLESLASEIYRGERKLLGIGFGCNGLELGVLYLGFLICFEAPWKRKIAFAVGGILAIHAVNVLRCYFLAEIISSSWRSWFNFAHHYFFTMLVYGFIFLLWRWFVKGINFAALVERK